MSNHLHLIAGAGDEGNLSDILRDFKKFTSKSIIDAIKENPESRLIKSTGKLKVKAGKGILEAGEDLIIDTSKAIKISDHGDFDLSKLTSDDIGRIDFSSY